jgi:16S rRNA processing protein RimM
VSGWVTIAVLGTTHANRGEITGVAMTNRIERFDKLRRVWLCAANGETREVQVESVWQHDGRPVFKFQGIDCISDAEVWNRAELRIPLSEREPLEEGEFYFSDLIGCEVWERKSGDRLGTVKEVREFGGPGLLELDNGLLIPFARSICVLINPAARRIEVDLPDGLRDLNP